MRDWKVWGLLQSETGKFKVQDTRTSLWFKKTALCSSAHFTYPHPLVWLCSFSQPTLFFFCLSLSSCRHFKISFLFPRRAIPTTLPLLTFQWVLSDWRVTWRRLPSSWRPSALMQGRCSGPVTWSATWARRETGKCQRYKQVSAIWTTPGNQIYTTDMSKRIKQYRRSHRLRSQESVVNHEGLWPTE